jgi:hypothetical protein
MITIIFNHLNEKVMVTINGNLVKFGNTKFGAVMADISGLKLDYAGCCREFPDLKLREDWRDEAIIRFKEKVASFSSEKYKAWFIIEDLRGHGYIPKLIQRDGFRSEVIR